MANIESGIVEIIIGLAIFLFRKWITESTVEARNRLFGFYIGQKMKLIYYWIVSLIGLASVIYGILTLFDIAK